MPNAQAYIYSLRKGHYFNALKFINYVNDKYSEVAKPLEPDELLPLVIYQSCLTDLNEGDISEINFLNHAINHDHDLRISQLGNKMRCQKQE